MNLNLISKKDSIKSFDGSYKHKKKVLNIVAKNQKRAKDLIHRFEFKGIFSEENFEDKFTLTGAIRIKDLNYFNSLTVDFLTEKAGRYFIKENANYKEYILRGPRYIVALDNHLSVIQKLDILLEDIISAKKSLTKYKYNNKNQFQEITVILDYLKNALLTLFNSFIHKEKLSFLQLDNEKYQNERTELIKAIKKSVLAYYLSLSDRLDEKTYNELIIILNNPLITSISKSIKKDYRDYSFSSKSLSRPEASHPLTLISFAINISNKYRNSKKIIGIPSGSTEISILTQQILKYFFRKECKVYLIPISFHSIKDIGKSLKSINYDSFLEMFPKNEHFEDLTLIIDDNSASGKTIDKLKNIVQKKNKYYPNIICAVVEADITRIEMNLKEKNKTSFSHYNLYNNSTGVLPISKIIREKFDLKDVIERRLLFHYYTNIKTTTLSEKILNEVIADCIENKYEDIKDSLDKSNSITNFKHTFLSNFYLSKFIYREKPCSSVEQGYLRYKYDFNVLSKLTENEKNQLNNVLKIKGIDKSFEDFTNAFYDTNLPAGILKRWSKKLRLWGYEDSDWDEKRLLIMIELLILKFSIEEHKKLLMSTNKKYLVEGNTWNDTFWGVCEGRGRNFLGRIIMNIRTKIENNNFY